MTNRNLTWHDAVITKDERRSKQQHSSCTLWFTGLSGSGKSTLANALSAKLFEKGIKEYVLDGDNIRHGLNADLGFTEKDRTENIRRIGEVAKLFVDSGTIVVTAFISPFSADRDCVREQFASNEFFEIFIDCPLAECEKRDPKKLYEKARRGEIKNFTGIDSPYEPPKHPDLTIRSDRLSVEEAITEILSFLQQQQIIKEL
ncbi:adenylyl-sulfate kinase [Cytobacillus sp. FSL W7-1323]|uniref:adenylyl-sulfate kinase n=1 Tax=unclassified Cytobacillus TaxID=2675268 RepID=UPI002B0021C5|nr:adenylyl-sulfate kinase [Cytobacillus sp. OWB-43]MEA1852268.1 adenylyl-sulfate kinase [Cytobacillus sp. OWB-43]